MQYDSYKVQAILNEIDGYDHSGTHHVGVPGIFGMNFQTVSTAQKLPTSDGLTGGYLPGRTVTARLVRALNYIRSGRRSGPRPRARAAPPSSSPPSTASPRPTRPP